MKKIPKIIHYFWFGNNPLPDELKEYIRSWKEYCPDYKIQKWDETNFDINICDYVSEAYKAKKWAFVSDYARFYILDKIGGIYLDTDVELIKSLTPIINNGPFLACENQNSTSVAPGLGMATYAGNYLYDEIVEDYNHDHFLLPNGLYNEQPVGERIVNKFLLPAGLKQSTKIQKVMGINIYPSTYFCPLNYMTGQMNITDKTVAIHHYSSSWMTKTDRRFHKLSQRLARFMGVKSAQFLTKTVKFPYTLTVKIKKIGFKKTIYFYYSKYIK
ncbi:glycosyltransferase family 32 protein [Lactobacillus gallinarum]|uniref:glycosyltransferase family 32 protein n=1 Tax=Lactobacillus gallinarum TaxID=52242 RepID=UPI0024B8C1BA|nr:glycosyltransferase [Lactobacillus gallinarum]